MGALSRTPSLRELQARPRDNVVVLPTAARRQVEQPTNAQARAERKALRAETAGRFPYRPPFARAVEPMAQALVEAGGSAEALLLLSILRSMPREERLAICAALGAIGSEASQRAYLLARTTLLDEGQAMTLRYEVVRIQREVLQ